MDRRPGTGDRLTGGERWFVAGGGLAFVAALTMTAWTFAVTFGGAAGPIQWNALLVDLLLTLAFAAHHSLFARSWLKARLAAFIPDRLLRSTYVYVASGLLVLLCLAWQPIGGELFAFRGPAALPVRALQLLGLLLIVWSARTIDPLELAGIRKAPANGAPTSSGPYAYVRHPLYLGWILIVFCSPVLTGDRLTFAALTSAYIALAIPWEERDLRRNFGAGYDRYRERVRWRLIPLLY